MRPTQDGGQKGLFFTFSYYGKSQLYGFQDITSLIEHHALQAMSILEGVKRGSERFCNYPKLQFHPRCSAVSNRVSSPPLPRGPRVPQNGNVELLGG